MQQRSNLAGVQHLLVSGEPISLIPDLQGTFVNERDT